MKTEHAIIFSLLAFTCLFGGVVALSSFSGGRDKAVSESPEVRDFSGVVFTTGDKLIITQGSTEGLTIEGGERLMEQFDIAVQNGVLRISRKPFSWFDSQEEAVFNLRVKNLDSLTLTGSGSAVAESLEVKDLSVTVNGSGDVRLDTVVAASLDSTITGSGDVYVENCNADRVSAKITGSGDMEIAGEAVVDSLDVRLSGSGSFRGEGLAAVDVTVAVTGSGAVHTNASGKLTARISGSGDVFYRGSPEVDSSASGSGRVRED